jgi:hypothetical protein
MKTFSLRCASLLAALSFITPAHAVIYYFHNITNNGGANVAGQLQVDVSAGSNSASAGNDVLFTFKNIGSIQSSITDIYFEDTNLLTLPVVFAQSAGVSFAVGANPVALPGASSVNFVTNATLSSDSNSPTQPNGINNTNNGSEWLKMTVALQGSATYLNVINELNAGQLRIGLHIQGFSNGQSEGYVNNGPTPPPPPSVPDSGSTLFLLGLGILGLRAFARRR